jgi:hypothetical protein
MHLKSAMILASLLFVSQVQAASAPTEADVQRMIIETKNSIVEGFLVGTWSTVNYFGRLVDPATGQVVQSLHSGRWFTFREDRASYNRDRTYQFMRSASGQFISGVIVAEGTFKIDGRRLLLHRRTESWYPSPNDPSGRPMYKDRPGLQDSSFDIIVLEGEILTLREEDQTVTTFRRGPGSDK